MNARSLRRLAIVTLFVAVASAAYLLPRSPTAAFVLLALVAGGVFVVWWTRRDQRHVVAAGLRCDLDALERFAAKGGARIFATLALVHHGGFARARTSLCTCGECENDAMDDELERTARIVRAAYEGRGEKAYELARDVDPEAKDVPPILSVHVSQMRLIALLVAYAAVVEEDAARADLPADWAERVVGITDTSWPFVRWPARLAAAREAAARGDISRAKKLLVDMPAWPEGSPLERMRQRLLEA